MPKVEKKSSTNGGGSDLSKRLKAIRENWDASREESRKSGGFGSDVPDGRYETRLTNAEVREGKNDSLGVVFEFTIVEGDNTGEKLTRWAGFDTEERLVYLQRDLRRLGVDVDDFEPEDLPDQLTELVKAAPTVRCTVKHRDEYVNVFIDKLLSTDEAPPARPAKSGKASKPKEEPEEEEGEDTEPADDELAIGDGVSYKVKGKKTTGVIKQVYTDDTADVRNDDTKKTDNLPVDSLEKLVETE